MGGFINQTASENTLSTCGSICPKYPTYSKVHNKLGPYAPFFDGCIGALDGTHILAHVCHESRLDYINRKGWPSYNILSIVDMDMRFTFVGAGLAGSYHVWEKRIIQTHQ
jgi:hypothetical protein